MLVIVCCILHVKYNIDTTQYTILLTFECGQIISHDNIVFYTGISSLCIIIVNMDIYNISPQSNNLTKVQEIPR